MAAFDTSLWGGVTAQANSTPPLFHNIKEVDKMATKWSHPMFQKARFDEQEAEIDALPTSAEAAVTYVSSAYGDVTFVKSSVI